MWSVWNNRRHGGSSILTYRKCVKYNECIDLLLYHRFHIQRLEFLESPKAKTLKNMDILVQLGWNLILEDVLNAESEISAENIVID